MCTCCMPVSWAAWPCLTSSTPTGALHLCIYSIDPDCPATNFLLWACSGGGGGTGGMGWYIWEVWGGIFWCTLCEVAGILYAHCTMQLWLTSDAIPLGRLEWGCTRTKSGSATDAHKLDCTCTLNILNRLLKVLLSTECTELTSAWRSLQLCILHPAGAGVKGPLMYL